MSNLLQVTPFLHVPDMDRAVRFFTELLGFNCTFRGHHPDYAYVEREAVAVRLIECAEGDPFRRPEAPRFAHYVDVRDTDALVAEIAPKLVAWPDVRVHGPVDQPYGKREYMLTAPDGDLIVFGQTIPVLGAPA